MHFAARFVFFERESRFSGPPEVMDGAAAIILLVVSLTAVNKTLTHAVAMCQPPGEPICCLVAFMAVPAPTRVEGKPVRPRVPGRSARLINGLLGPKVLHGRRGGGLPPCETHVAEKPALRGNASLFTVRRTLGRTRAALSAFCSTKENRSRSGGVIAVPPRPTREATAPAAPLGGARSVGIETL